MRELQLEPGWLWRDMAAACRSLARWEGSLRPGVTRESLLQDAKRCEERAAYITQKNLEGR